MRANRRLRCISAFAIVFSLIPVSVTLVRAEDGATSPGPVVDLTKIRIANFGRVSPMYYRGEQPVGRDYSDLAALGVRTVIDLQGDGDNRDEAQLVKKAGMTFYRIPMTTRVAPTAEEIAEFLRIVTDPVQEPVYVHCKGGRHRTGVMTAIYRIEQDGWSADQAFKEMKQYGFGADFLHPEFKRFVYSYKPGASVLAQSSSAPASK